MNKKNQHIKNEVQQTINVLQQLEKVEGNPYLLTRVMQQIESEKEGTARYFFTLSPVLKLTLGIVIIAINAFVLYQTNDVLFQINDSIALDFANEYDLGYVNGDALDNIFIENY